MRARKPWRRLRTFMLGWKVRFTGSFSADRDVVAWVVKLNSINFAAGPRPKTQNIAGVANPQVEGLIRGAGGSVNASAAIATAGGNASVTVRCRAVKTQ